MIDKDERNQKNESDMLCARSLCWRLSAVTGSRVNVIDRTTSSRLLKNDFVCHSEERSDEESLSFLPFATERFFASLRMTTQEPFFSTLLEDLCEK